MNCFLSVNQDAHGTLDESPGNQILLPETPQEAMHSWKAKEDVMATVLLYYSPPYSFETVNLELGWRSACPRDALVSTLYNSKVTSVQTQFLMLAPQALLPMDPRA